MLQACARGAVQFVRFPICESLLPCGQCVGGCAACAALRCVCCCERQLRRFVLEGEPAAPPVETFWLLWTANDLALFCKLLSECVSPLTKCTTHFPFPFFLCHEQI